MATTATAQTDTFEGGNAISLSASVPHLEQYFGPCLMHEDKARELVSFVNSVDVIAHIGDMRARIAAGDSPDLEPAGFLETDGGIAVIQLVGVITKRGSSLLGGLSTIRARQVLRQAAERASSIVLLIDSPGGTLPGVDDLARDVRRIAATKPVTAYIEDVGASAAYWIASQASRVVANPSAWVGSIGVFSTVVDSSQAAARKGLKIHIVKSAHGKANGIDGAEVTPEALAERQRMVDEVHTQFVDAVATGRRMSAEAVSEIADGRVYSAAEAQRLGLIDSVSDFDGLIASMVTSTSPAQTGLSMHTQNGVSDMPQAETMPDKAAAQEEEKPKDEEKVQEEEEDEPTTAPASDPEPDPNDSAEPTEDEEEEAAANKAATVHDLKAALPDATASFREACLEAGLTIAQAKAMHAAQLSAAPAPGGAGIKDSPKRGKRSAGDWLTEAKAYAEDNKCDLRTAMRKMAAENPDGHAAWLAAQSPKRT